MTAPAQSRVLSRRTLLLLTLLLATAASSLLLHEPEDVDGPRPRRHGPTVRPTVPTSLAPPTARLKLLRVATGLRQPTDIQVPPGHPDKVVVLQKQGSARLVRLQSGGHRPWFSVPVRSQSEQGLLGLAFHPRFRTNGRFFVHHTPKEGQTAVGRITAWRCNPETLANPRLQYVVLDVAQPYANHNGGQLAFGPGGRLFVGLGDGGSAGDPKGHGQNGGTLLGSILRLDVERRQPGYQIPSDNPFLADKSVHDAIFARGIRNPWRFSFTPRGALVVADVGQNAWEEVNIVPAGSNMGWNMREGRHCYNAPSCNRKGLVDPVWEYGHSLGGSITGGFVYTGNSLPALLGRYVVADFISGRIWAMRLPSQAEEPATDVELLGKFPINPVTFGRLSDGELLIADFTKGALFRLAAPEPPTATMKLPAAATP